MENKVFGKKLNYIRKQRKLTSEQLGELCDVNAGHIRQIESGMRVPSLKLLIDLCNVLCINPEYLLAQDLNYQNTDESDIYIVAYEKIKKLSPEQIEMLNCILEAVIKKNGS